MSTKATSSGGHGRLLRSNQTPLRRSPSKMSTKATSSGGHGRLLRSNQTPLRRSPRFASPKNEDSNIKKPNSRKKPERPSADNTHLRSPLISLNPHEIPSPAITHHVYPPKSPKGTPRSAIPVGSRRRSPRLASILAEATNKGVALGATLSPDLQELASGKKAQQGYPPESQKKPSRSTGRVAASQRRRQSVRLACSSAEAEKEGASLDATAVKGKVKERKRPAKLKGSVKVSRKAEVGPSGGDGDNGNSKRGRGSNVSLPDKRRKIEANRSTGMEEHCGLQGQMKEHCEGKVGIARKKGEECCRFEGWTEDQETLLRRAYLSAKPSPLFWKKVSKMVPGKTAQECFDRVHANFATPPQHQPRSRTNKMNLSPIGNFTLSGNLSTGLAERKIGRLRNSKKKTLGALKTARDLLRKHCLTDQSQQADYFSVLETSPNALNLPDIRTPATVNCISNTPSVLQKCNERSTSAHKSLLSRLKTQNKPKYVSPEVLRKIKNMALHEKYIDILHCREARRRTTAKTSSFVAARSHMTVGELNTGTKAARTALMSEARDVISNFQQMQANSWYNIEDFDTDDDADNDDGANDDEYCGGSR